jgi:hypothetical protein
MRLRGDHGVVVALKDDRKLMRALIAGDRRSCALRVFRDRVAR